ncbi:unnamed protein product [Onchocerca flexuosa]|uniref:EF-hand domain-containing protein n=1 Tax=Onchocerca flexuosa TaxID=387005 RepID=A0A183HNG0_9BILA|nr:unnamed protein product [Onchocerca flexuosa]
MITQKGSLILWNHFLISNFKGNGYIAVSDLRDILRALDENISEDELDEMIADIDTDGSGTVDFDGELELHFYNLEEIHSDFRILQFMEMMSGE